MQPLWVEPQTPALILAPMEGVTDATMRALLTELGGFSFCVSEFLRITTDVPPARTFYEHVPELKTNAITPSGIPVQVQLLGGNEEMLARCALRATQLGAKAIDLNFGCPSPTVNRHDGGATLLKYPDRIQKIVRAVRTAVPSTIPVSAKLRLGWENPNDIYANAEQAALGGASWLTIHARTKVQGYAPPAYWQFIGGVKKQLQIPVVANGDIWTFDDFRRCQDITGSSHFMLGRGALADPSLAPRIAKALNLKCNIDLSASKYTGQTQQWIPVLTRFAKLAEPISLESKHYTCRRIKQWLQFAHKNNPIPWFDALKRAQNLQEVFDVLTQS